MTLWGGGGGGEYNGRHNDVIFSKILWETPPQWRKQCQIRKRERGRAQSRMVYTFRVELEKDEAGGLGLGIEGGNGEGDGRFVVSVLLPGRPAAEQGSLRLGDVLVSVNGTPLAGLTLEEGCALIAMRLPLFV